MEGFFTKDERCSLPSLCRSLAREVGMARRTGDFGAICKAYAAASPDKLPVRDRFGFNPVLAAIATATALCRSVEAPQYGSCRAAVAAFACRRHSVSPMSPLCGGDDVAKLVRGLDKVASLYNKSASVESDNFRKLLLTFAEDIRVIIIMIVDRLALMRAINHHPAERFVRDTAYMRQTIFTRLWRTASACMPSSRNLRICPLKYSNREVYTRIAHELNETKARRDAYIAEFIVR